MLIYLFCLEYKMILKMCNTILYTNHAIYMRAIYVLKPDSSTYQIIKSVEVSFSAVQSTWQKSKIYTICTELHKIF